MANEIIMLIIWSQSGVYELMFINNAIINLSELNKTICLISPDAVIAWNVKLSCLISCCIIMYDYCVDWFRMRCSKM